MTESNKGASLERLVSTMQRLLSPQGCPWDREQTLESLRPYVIEEAHEVVEAIDEGSPEHLREELGDLLLQVVFQSELARNNGWFTIDDVVNAICDKLERRHPHVFGSESASTSEEVLRNWEKLKAKEKEGRGLLDGVPAAMPALLRALRVGEKAARVGFDWPSEHEVRAKLDEELRELDEALSSAAPARIQGEIGDVLFTVANLARKVGVDPETALRETLDRFRRRFVAVETAVREQGRSLDELDDAERNSLWETAKRDVRTL